MKITIESGYVHLHDKFTPHMKHEETYHHVDKFEINRFSSNVLDITLHGNKKEENEDYLSKTIHLDGHVTTIIVENEIGE